MESGGKLTIGLEVHVGLKTATKMFCPCANDPRETRPNANICPVCAGHPGTLPTINRRAVEAVLTTGMALGGTVFPKGRSKFDRKNYFYPDLPKGYQISQYDEPLVEGGALNGIRITRIHLEEDAGGLTHAPDASLVDLNRAGTPLMELVTEPDIRSADEAVAFAKELWRIVRYLGVSDADMELGLMRLEANVSIDMGTKAEVKNINSFRALHDAIVYEYERQSKALAAGEKIIQETRGWDGNKGVTVSQRSKEDAHDYRYFPEPDLPPLDATAFDLETLRAAIPELPIAKRERYAKEFSLPEKDADILVEDRASAEWFEEAANELAERAPNPDYKLLSNYFISDLWGMTKKEGIGLADLKFGPADFSLMVSMAQSGKISSRGAKDMLAEMLSTGKNPEAIAQEKGLLQISDDGALAIVAEAVFAENPEAVADFKKGKTAAINTLVGKAIKATNGAGNPAALKAIFEGLLIK